MEAPFTQYFFSIPGITPQELFSLFLLTLFRLVPIAVLCPFLGAKVAPSIAKAGIIIFLAILFLPTTLLSLENVASLETSFVTLALKEFVIGTFIAFISNVPFYIVQATGIIVDHMRGSSMMMMQDPSFQQQASPIGILYNYLLIVLFYQLNGMIFFFDAIDTSFLLYPPSAPFPLLFTSSHAAWEFSSALIGTIFAMSIQLGAPSILAILMAEVFLGIANRMAPQVQIAFLGMSLKSLAGLLLLTLAFFYVSKVMGENMVEYYLNFSSLLHLSAK